MNKRMGAVYIINEQVHGARVPVLCGSAQRSAALAKKKSVGRGAGDIEEAMGKG